MKIIELIRRDVQDTVFLQRIGDCIQKVARKNPSEVMPPLRPWVGKQKIKSFHRTIRAADSAQRIKCPRVASARFRFSPPCGELSLRAWSTARSRGNFSSGTVAPFRREKTHRRTQDRHTAARSDRKVAQDRDARRATLQLGDSRSKIVAASKPGSTHKTFGVVTRDSALWSAAVRHWTDSPWRT